jgi:RNA polymerase sigma-70 factor (ECF subfamily)
MLNLADCDDVDENEYSFDDLCVPLYDEMLRFAIRLSGGDQARASDVIQDSYAKACAAWPRWRPDGDPHSFARAWLYRVVANTYMKQYRRAVNAGRRAHESREEVMLATYGQAQEPDLRDNVDSPFGDEVEVALAQLSTEHRTVIEAFYIREIGCTQLAKELGIPKNTVFTRLGRARLALQRLLADFAEQEYGYQRRRRARKSPARVDLVEATQNPQPDAYSIEGIMGHDDDAALEDGESSVDELTSW